ncbi:MAG: 3-deoxy-manno-octulosonate cytidylyltransferase [Ignavibacteriales bacterium]|nr:MAG: 3-deoxy-manno-octulosonate cytidylyltransferase [Ignavibacteriaceae bacterium]MBW7872060.1 3-deoxy-manno-octulosonate cytidylyltransferase [Ignavibacteria bacterium]MCZ2143695.1 3-deoxy-manno-octulosonate cytidylyltransferase [Ignavibacteriales bacterium]OQY79619.1 MAG: 3-deoxy-D-manno-octulosonate cytidylyltransferase [Ignavibacteriales bacterium UTCHB3]MBV6446043.1 3-deoxy-manno-octulosonate cytidylyltransferase [Ignavibacteriaceae bacterium]
MRTVAVIPARYASTRLPGKPLVQILDKPMIEWVYRSVKSSRLVDSVIVATDDQRIFDAVKGFGGKVVMTPDDIQTGSDRIAYVANQLNDTDIIVNVQGDEPFISGGVIDDAVMPLIVEPALQVATLVKKITTAEELNNPSVVKVVFDKFSNAVYFSRSPIPYLREKEELIRQMQSGLFYKHIGLYVYRRDFLLHYTRLPQSQLENAEKLEQLRILENGYKIRVVETVTENISVDTPEDLYRARTFALSFGQLRN